MNYGDSAFNYHSGTVPIAIKLAPVLRRGDEKGVERTASPKHAFVIGSRRISVVASAP